MLRIFWRKTIRQSSPDLMAAEILDILAIRITHFFATNKGRRFGWHLLKPQSLKKTPTDCNFARFINTARPIFDR